MRRSWSTVAALAICGCAAAKTQPVRLSEAQVGREIARWEAAAQRPDRAAEAYRHLFELYTLPSPTTPDYDRSEAALSSLLALDREASTEPEVRRWRAVLSALKEARAGSRKEREENGALRGEVRDLKKTLGESRKENQELRDTLEKLKELDLQMDRLHRGR